MPIIKPPADQVFKFIWMTHAVEKLPCDYVAVERTASSPNKNWFADGHLRAISTAINKILPSTDYPTRFPSLTTRYQSDEALHWLKTLHLQMLEPVARNPVNLVDAALKGGVSKVATHDAEPVLLAYLGIWRTQPAGNLMGSAPPAQLITAIMHNWLVQLKTIHDKVKDRVDNPYGITKAEYREMVEFATEQPAFFSSVQPFKDANNRFGRLIENVIRLGWRLPFRADVMEGYDLFKDSLEVYQQTKLPQIIKAARELRC
jgi:hypothetical protein